ncbi:MAG: hypothetical protein ACXV5L_08290 [Thermoanaerobaculia bacterium]
MNRSEEYLRELYGAMADRYSGDCLKHARTIRDLLVAEGRNAWIARLRKTEKFGDATFHAPLIPLRYRGRGGPTWTTHYVCCFDGKAYDPLLGAPVPIAGYSMAVFGEEFEVEPMPGD